MLNVFQEKWTNILFFIEVNVKPGCLVCGEALAAMKKVTLERRYSPKHADLHELKGQMRLHKMRLFSGVWGSNKQLSQDEQREYYMCRFYGE